MSNLVGNAANGWLLGATFSVIMLFGFGFGFLRGWKKSLYFLGWNVLMLIITIFIAPSLTGALVKAFDGDAGIIVKETQTYFAPVLMIPLLLVFNSLAWIPYIWVRKYLGSKDDYVNPNDGLGIYGSRFIGIGIGMLATLPMAVLTTNAVSITTGHTSFTTLNGALVKTVTLGQYDGIADEMSTVTSVMTLAKKEATTNEFSGLESLVHLLTGNIGVADDENHTKKVSSLVSNHKSLEKILNSELAHSLIQKVSLINSAFISIDYNVWANFNNFALPVGVEPFKISVKAEGSLAYTLMYLYALRETNGDSTNYGDEVFTNFITALKTRT